MAKHIIVRTPSGEVEHFRGENLKATIEPDGSLYVYEVDSPSGDNLGVFKSWDYARNADS